MAIQQFPNLKQPTHCGVQPLVMAVQQEILQMK